jgi:tRNA (guanine26-N2/guanine27-N2)-dimethyltransferase
VWHIMLEWVRQKAPLKNPLKQNSPGYAIMSKASAHQTASTNENEKQNQPAAATSAAEETASPGQMLDSALNGTGSGTENTEQAGPGSNGEDRPSYLDVNFDVKFDESLGRDMDRGKYVRYQVAPRENWGPMSRAR